jgi:hypothetical protein
VGKTTWGGGIRAILYIAMCGALAACTGTETSDAPTWEATHDTIGDTVVVRTMGGSLWGDTARLEPEVTIGELEGADEYMLGRIRSLAVAEDGTIYAVDQQVPALRVYNPDGTYKATFGREGGGPGEYNRPDGGLAVLSDGRVVLRDPGNARLTVYSPAGDPFDTWRVMGSVYTSRRLYRDTLDNVYTYALLDSDAGIDNWQWGIVRIGPDGTVGDTLELPEWDYEPAEISASGGDEGNTSFIGDNVPFSPTVAWAYSPLGYMVGGISTKYSISLFLSTDRTLRIERGDWQPLPVTPEEREEQERIITANMRQLDPGWRWNGPPIPETKPPFQRFFIGEDGRIWVQLSQPAYKSEDTDYTNDTSPPGVIEVPPHTWVEPIAFDVFEPDGTYLGMVRAPEGFSMNPTPVARGDYVWAVVMDELEVPYIVRFRIKHPDEET